MSSLPRPWWPKAVLWIVHYVFGYRCPQVSLTERYEAIETLSAYGENESVQRQLFFPVNDN